MEQIIKLVTENYEAVLQLLGSLVVFATAITKLTPGPGDDAKVEGVAAKYFKLLSYLPTLGVNPRTKKLEEAYKELKK